MRLSPSALSDCRNGHRLSRSSNEHGSAGGSSTARRSGDVRAPVRPRLDVRTAVVRSSRFIVENKWVVAFTTLLTVWVLLGEDLKLMVTNKEADETFGIIGICCIVVFSLEILLSSIGKEDYFLGFFFVLDVISTASLVLDLPWVSDAVSGQDGSAIGGAEKGRTARVGARSARVVRVIRLVRIAKLYKAFHETSSRQRQTKQHIAPGEEDDEYQADNESRVGKKLSDLTIRRVIVLVLSMLIVVPLLSPEESFKIATSAQYGADEVWMSFERLAADEAGSRLEFQRSLLRFMYFHNWYTGNGECPPAPDKGACPNSYKTHLFWVGMKGASRDVVREKAALARLEQSVVESWAANQSNQNNIFNFGPMPEPALEFLWQEWAPCDGEDPVNDARYGISLLRETIPGTPLDHALPCYSDLRAVETSLFVPGMVDFQQYDDLHLEFWFDARPFVRESAMFSILTTAFVCVVLCAAAMLFYNDVNQLVLYPVEEMISKVQAIRDNPLKAVSLAEKAYEKEVAKATRPGGRKAKEDARGGVLEKAHSVDFGNDKEPSSPTGGTWAMRMRLDKAKRLLACTTRATSEAMETVILEKTIIKLGSLLALGFGEAGAQIIASNMVGSSYGVNVMVPGQRIDCVIGHARIQNFSVATEVLQSRVMNFVNQVAEIVHGVVEEHYGAANKNNGDTFLLVWRCLAGAEDSHDAPGGPVQQVPASKLCDMSILSFAKIIGAVHKSSVLAAYRGHPGLQNKLGSQYRVHLTCGLHYGWVIEGAVGSEYKIEASYLSPNVAVAVNVEDATQIYRVSFLASEAVVKNCDPAMREKCRLIDRVLIPGSRAPFELYAIDLDHSQMEVERRQSKKAFGAKLRMQARQYLEAEKRQKPFKNIPDLFDQDVDIQIMRRSYTTDFFEIFRMGYQNYFEGEWKVAQAMLTKISAVGQRCDSFDGPSAALMRFMDAFDYKAPDWWKGIHDLSAGTASESSTGAFGSTLRYTL